MSYARLLALVTVGLGAIGAYLGKDGVQKILGPTADYIGEGLRDFTKRRVTNVGNIFKSAEDKLGDEIDNPGVVPPKVLKAVLNEGSYSEEPLSTGYLGGVLASSRTEVGRDDRGARIAKIIDGMSCYQLRAHYLIYSSICQTFKGKEFDFGRESRGQMEIYFSFRTFVQTMDFTEDEYHQTEMLTKHIFFGLSADLLIENDFVYGEPDYIGSRFPEAKEAGTVVIPSAQGAELFMWGLGRGKKHLNYMFEPNFKSDVDSISSIIEGVLPTKS